MTTRPHRIVDAHVHLWDPARADWYPYLAGRRRIELGDVDAMARRFDVATYRAEAGGWNVEKLVNIAAATGHHAVDEALEMDRRAAVDGHPDAIIGGLPPTERLADAVAILERQMGATRFRGVRPMGAWDRPLPDDDVLRAVAERGLIFELMARPNQLVDAARTLAAHPDLVVVVEHLGWPRSGSDEEWSLWSSGIAAVSDAGERVVCKLSGLAMPLGGISVERFRPWLERAIEVFGVDRCFFASNFPVDGLHGTLDQLWSVYAEVTAGLDADARDQLFARNAERIYAC